MQSDWIAGGEETVNGQRLMLSLYACIDRKKDDIDQP
jgi:hypothetical protein